jgi:hypothetical protein
MPEVISNYQFNQLGVLHGIPVYTNPSLVVFDKNVQKRTHKSKRINKKWAKRYGFKTLYKPDPRVMFTGGAIIGHPITIRNMKNLVETQEGK